MAIHQVRRVRSVLLLEVNLQPSTQVSAYQTSGDEKKAELFPKLSSLSNCVPSFALGIEEDSA